jgi:hypothetical protein
MGSRPGSSIYSIVEKAYFRLQAGDVLTRCLEVGSTEPLHGMIQEMVVAGPRSMDALREILMETAKRKSQVYDDLNQVTNQLSIILKGYGIGLEKQGGNQGLQNLSEMQLMVMLDEEHIEDEETRTSSSMVLKDSQELMATLHSKIALLENIETYLLDWLWGLAYQYMKRGEEEAGKQSTWNELQ